MRFPGRAAAPTGAGRGRIFISFGHDGSGPIVQNRNPDPPGGFEWPGSLETGMPRALPLLVPLLALAVLCPVSVRAEDETAAEVVLDSPEAVKKAMAHREAPVRLAAARAAAGLQDRLLTAPLVKLLKDKELVVRQAAIEAGRGEPNSPARKSRHLTHRSPYLPRTWTVGRARPAQSPASTGISKCVKTGKMAPEEGLEPPTRWLTATCSTS